MVEGQEVQGRDHSPSDDEEEVREEARREVEVQTFHGEDHEDDRDEEVQEVHGREDGVEDHEEDLQMVRQTNDTPVSCHVARMDLQ